MIIVGGTYYETCLEPQWDQIYGSGFRACLAILNNCKDLNINFYTFGDEEISEILESFSQRHPNFHFKIKEIHKNPEFQYDTPLFPPRIFPRPDILVSQKNHLDVSGENILFFGLLEGTARINGKKVVYDPQSPSNPIPFSQTGSSAKELVCVMNLSEGKKISKTNCMEDIKDYFFNVEDCHAIILKMGPLGARVITKEETIYIPLYKTPKIWTIGSGDIFTSMFAFYWFTGASLKESANLASKATAIYCSSKSLHFKERLSSFNFEELKTSKTSAKSIYLAGPFFTFSQRWLINNIRASFLDMGIKVFSPLHDVGFGEASEVVQKDLSALEKVDLVFAVADGLDSGTLFEIGYASSKNIPVVSFVQNESKDSLLMLEGSNCTIESDLTTSVYKAVWKIFQYE